jgi:hypothetical protein
MRMLLAGMPGIGTIVLFGIWGRRAVYVAWSRGVNERYTTTMIFQMFLRKIHGFARLSWFERLWLFPAWLLLGIACLVILAVPFRRLAHVLGSHVGIAPWVPVLDAKDEARALSIARVVQTVARRTPWESNCFPQAIVARLLLGLYGVPCALFLGVRDASGVELKAHAWVVSGRVCVTGGRSFDRFTVVGCFVSSEL